MKLSVCDQDDANKSDCSEDNFGCIAKILVTGKWVSFASSGANKCQDSTCASTGYSCESDADCGQLFELPETSCPDQQTEADCQALSESGTQACSWLSGEMTCTDDNIGCVVMSTDAATDEGYESLADYDYDIAPISHCDGASWSTCDNVEYEVDNNPEAICYNSVTKQVITDGNGEAVTCPCYNGTCGAACEIGYDTQGWCCDPSSTLYDYDECLNYNAWPQSSDFSNCDFSSNYGDRSKCPAAPCGQIQEPNCKDGTCYPNTQDSCDDDNDKRDCSIGTCNVEGGCTYNVPDPDANHTCLADGTSCSSDSDCTDPCTANDPNGICVNNKKVETCLGPQPEGTVCGGGLCHSDEASSYVSAVAGITFKSSSPSLNDKCELDYNSNVAIRINPKIDSTTNAVTGVPAWWNATGMSEGQGCYLKSGQYDTTNMCQSQTSKDACNDESECEWKENYTAKCDIMCETAGVGCGMSASNIESYNLIATVSSDYPYNTNFKDVNGNTCGYEAPQLSTIFQADYLLKKNDGNTYGYCYNAGSSGESLGSNTAGLEAFGWTNDMTDECILFDKNGMVPKNSGCSSDNDAYAVECRDPTQIYLDNWVLRGPTTDNGETKVTVTIRPESDPCQFLHTTAKWNSTTNAPWQQAIHLEYGNIGCDQYSVTDPDRGHCDEAVNYTVRECGSQCQLNDKNSGCLSCKPNPCVMKNNGTETDGKNATGCEGSDNDALNEGYVQAGGTCSAASFLCENNENCQFTY